MARPGPPPKPTNLRMLHGDEARYINRNEPQPNHDPAEPPDYLSAEARAVWAKLAPDLIRNRLLTAWDVHQFAVYCDAVVRFERAAATVHAEGLMVPSQSGQSMRNPALAAYRDLANLMRHYATEFGLTPAARVQFTVPKGEAARGGAERLLS